MADAYDLQAEIASANEAAQAAAATALLELTQLESVPSSDFDEPPGEANLVRADMRLVRDGSEGTLGLVCGADTAWRLAERYLPSDIALADDIVDDVLGEFLNVVAGQTKTMLKGHSLHFNLTTPRVSRGGAIGQPIAVLLTEIGGIGIVAAW